jgi:hypothetical protein
LLPSNSATSRFGQLDGNSGSPEQSIRGDGRGNCWGSGFRLPTIVISFRTESGFQPSTFIRPGFDFQENNRFDFENKKESKL